MPYFVCKLLSYEVLDCDLTRCFLSMYCVHRVLLWRTHLHNVLGDENVLTVKFADVPGEATYCNDIYSTYKEIAKKGIMLGLRRYKFFGEFLIFFFFS